MTNGFRPMDIGGYDGSSHSAALSQLVRKGLVESRVRSTGVRGSKLYRLTAAGYDYACPRHGPDCRDIPDDMGNYCLFGHLT